MNYMQSFRLAFRSIISNRMRSVLTMLGMIIGVASVIMIMGLMEGVTNYISASFSDLGTNTIPVMVSENGNRKATVDDMYAIVSEHSDIISSVTPSVSGSFTMKNGTESLTEGINGVGEDYADINAVTLSQGRFINYADILTRQNNCVLGTYVIGELFENDDVLGKTVKINGENFTIVGIVEEKEKGGKNTKDDCVYIPYSKLTRMIQNTTISSYTFAVYDVAYVDQAMDAIEERLYEILGDEDYYSTLSLVSMLDMLDSIMGMLSSALAGIAAISLVVAGIGIMNIMLVSVTERTQEIGIRKSLGAKKKDILSQFIIEAGLVSGLGGFIGIVFGVAMVFVIGNALDVQAAPTMSSISSSFGISVAIGILFGYMPAKKAANLNPIDALRSD